MFNFTWIITFKYPLSDFDWNHTVTKWILLGLEWHKWMETEC